MPDVMAAVPTAGTPGDGARGNMRKPMIFQAGEQTFTLGGRTLIMGILNVTPDSFSDGGRYDNLTDAMKQAEKMLAAGADILDIGGESTRPGSTPVSLEDEMSRVIPVVSQIVRSFGCALSIDTYKPAVAEAAMAAGACIINDIYGLQKDPDMIRIAKAYRAGLIMMHNAQLYRPLQTAGSDHLMADVRTYLGKSIELARDGGLFAEQLVLDPGIGFGVTPAESIVMIKELIQLADFNLPILVGPSRKRFIGHLLDAPVSERIFGTAAAVAIAIAHGADIVRVHDVREMADVVRVTDALCRP